ncbi:imm11 family protein [Corallococcus exercitus]|uniref:imm11 family protein n=1 Tax=Corallococcus exercitus TaxID=2316736 RepID=UPI0035D42CAA
MTARFFELSEDVQEGMWVLEVPWNELRQEEEDPWMFTKGSPVRVEGHLTVPIGDPGRPHDFSRIPFGLTPVVHVKLANVLLEHAADDVQLIPVTIPKHPDQYALLVATKLIRCIDEQASEGVRFWEPRHGQPWRIGEYRSVDIMRIDKSQVGDAKIFRPWGWNVALIVSEDLKTALERTGATGMYFTEV